MLYTCCFFFYKGFLFQTLAIHRTTGKGKGPSLFFFTTSTQSWTFRHLFATLLVRWLPHIFEWTTCVYQTATQWYLPPYWCTIFVIDDEVSIPVLFTWRFDWWFYSRLFIAVIWHRKPVDLSLHQQFP